MAAPKLTEVTCVFVATFCVCFLLDYLLLSSSCFSPQSFFWLAVILSASCQTVFGAAFCIQSLLTWFAGKAEISGKFILITGCDTGFGHDLAIRLDAMGVKVFACCLFKNLNGKGCRELEEKCSSNLVTIQMDVTDPEQIKAASDIVAEKVGTMGLWGVVNNAGISSFGEVELHTLEMYKRLMEVNVWGVVRVTKAFLPLVRQSKGRVVNIVSGLGRLCHPRRSSYGMSKYACEALSDCLRYEMKHWDVDVCIITPGNYLGATNIITKEGVRKMADEMWDNACEEVRNSYTRDALDKSVNAISQYVGEGVSSIQPVIEAYVSALSDKRPQARYYPTGWYWFVKIFVFTHFPEAFAEAIYF